MHHLAVTPLSCSACTASLQFYTPKSYCLICANCQTINYQAEAPNTLPLQKIEPVLEDMSIIRIGTTGATAEQENVTFKVIGRLQYFFQERYRNHWFVSYSNGITGWLGDWDGNYSLFTSVEEVRNTFENPSPGKKVQIKKIEYITEQLDVNRRVLAEGELGKFYLDKDKFITLEFYTTSGQLALAHIFANKKVEAFTGKYLELEALNLKDLRLHHDWV